MILKGRDVDKGKQINKTIDFSRQTVHKFNRHFIIIYKYSSDQLVTNKAMECTGRSYIISRGIIYASVSNH